MRRARELGVLALVITAIVACCTGSRAVKVADPSGDPLWSVEPLVDVPGLPTTFQKNHVMDDAFYTNADWATVAEIQAFLENTVWNKRSWLASERIALVNAPSRAPMLVSEAIVATAHDHHINPLLLLARMQVEKSLVSADTRPPESVRSFGLGCHKTSAAHPNGLDPSVAAFNVQLECGATTFENQLTKALSSDNNFVVDRDATTQDGTKIRPTNAATSALYAYTPLEGTKARNGNWLVWKITHRFAAAIQEARKQP